MNNEETLVQFPIGAKDICLPHINQKTSVSPNIIFNGYRGTSLRVKWLVYEADY
jgi:hypothetical protein